MCRSLSEPADPRAFAAELLRKALPTTEGDATFDDAARAFLDLVCGAMNWCVGRVWRPDPAQPGLRLATAWAASGECGSATHPATADVDSTIPFSARTVVGDAVEQSAPVWREIVDDSRFVSLPADDPLRSRRLFAFPVIADERVVAVLEFVADEPHDAILLSSVLDLAVSRLSAIAEMEQCEAERERLSAVVEHSVQPVFTVSALGVIQTWNTGAVRTYGYRGDEAVGSPVSLLLPLDAAEEPPEVGEALATGKIKRVAAVRRRKDGRLFEVLSTVTPIRDSVGRIAASLRVDQLEHDVAVGERRERQLDLARRASQRARRTKTEFLANVSHELRTPMSAVIGMIELTLGEDLSPTAREYLNTAGDSARVMLALVNDLLDQTRMEAGKFELETEAFRLRRLLDDSMRGLAFRAHECGLELTFDVDPQTPDLLEGDGRRFRQVVTNLVNNALKFTDQGEIVVRLFAEPGSHDEVLVHCIVSDTGVGVAPEDQDRIFAPFTQVDSSTTRRRTGAGLGLAISREIAARMGGRLWCEGRGGEGATFHFTAKLRALPDEPQLVDDRLEQLRGLPVLIVDDNATNRRIMEATLADWAMRPVAVATGEQALAEIEEAHRKRRPFSLVIVDALMPGMDGFQLVETLRDRGLADAATVLMLSSGDRETFENRCQGLPVARYLEKPISRRALMEAVLGALPADGQRAEETAAPRRPLSLLVVEDTPANQKVVRTLLERQGHHVRVAVNGREALEIHKRFQFDLVLMDIQMPAMDGFQTTAAIRALDDLEKASVPIIAMTAHAMAGDRLRCLRAGMNSYIAKPLDSDELLQLVERTARRRGDDVAVQPPSLPPAAAPLMEAFPSTSHRGEPPLRPQRQGESAIDAAVRDTKLSESGLRDTEVIRSTPADHPRDKAESAAPAKPPAEKTFQSGGGALRADGGLGAGPSARPARRSMASPLDTAAALKRIGGDRSLLRDLGQFFLEDAPPYLTSLKEALLKGDASEVERAAHCLKGLAANFNAVDMQAAAQAVEQHGRAARLEAASQLVARLESELGVVVEAVKKEIMGD